MTGSSPHRAPERRPSESGPALPEVQPIVAHARSEAPTPASFAARSARFERITAEYRAHRRRADIQLAGDAETSHVMDVPGELKTQGAGIVAAREDRQPLFTVDDLAGLLQVSAKTVRTWRRERKLPLAIEVGGVVRWRASDIEVWLEASRG